MPLTSIVLGEEKERERAYKTIIFRCFIYFSCNSEIKENFAKFINIEIPPGFFPSK
jgi:hypothetical protein